jgi:hypothetical protein
VGSLGMHGVLQCSSHFIIILQLLGEAEKVKGIFIIFGKYLRYFYSIKLVRLHYKIADAEIFTARKP